MQLLHRSMRPRQATANRIDAARLFSACRCMAGSMAVKVELYKYM